MSPGCNCCLRFLPIYQVLHVSSLCCLVNQRCMFTWHAGARKHYSKDCDSKLAVLWVILVQPLLFGAIGIEIDFRNIQGSLIWKTVIILALG